MYAADLGWVDSHVVIACVTRPGIKRSVPVTFSRAKNYFCSQSVRLQIWSKIENKLVANFNCLTMVRFFQKPFKINGAYKT